MWQDYAMAALLALGLVATWEMVLNPETRAPVGASLRKAASAAGLGALQASLGLWATAAVSAVYTTAFILLAVLRPVKRTRLCHCGEGEVYRDGYCWPCYRDAEKAGVVL